MKKILIYLCLLFVLFLFGCKSNSLKKLIDSDYSLKEEKQLFGEEKVDDDNVNRIAENQMTNENNLGAISFVDDTNQIDNNIMIEDEELKKHISNMSKEELLDFISQYKGMQLLVY